ncbi:hypothetical protein C0J52_05135 [Blattella germanica]|nr:hypothetical protein C0J52_05135 [Blattella germanica]
MSVASVYIIITKKLKMRKVAARWVPHHLINEQKACCQRIAEELFQRYQTKGEHCLALSITVRHDSSNDHVTKCERRHWLNRAGLRMRKLSSLSHNKSSALKIAQNFVLKNSNEKTRGCY